MLKLCLKAVFIIKSLQLIRVRMSHSFLTMLFVFKRLLRPSPVIPEIEVDDGLGRAMNSWGTFDILNEVSFYLVL